MRVHMESWCPEIEQPDAPSLPWSEEANRGSWLLRGTYPSPTPTPHLSQLFEIVCVKVKVE